MIGAIAGDIIGSVYERNNIKTKAFELFTSSSFFTDDTVLSVAIADAILQAADAAHISESAMSRLDETLRSVVRQFMATFCGAGRLAPGPVPPGAGDEGARR